MIQTNPFERLVGEELNAVAFVMDYVEFCFNGPRVRALANPITHTSAGEIRFPSIGSRDALCSFIGQTVAHVTLEESQSLELSFLTGDVLVIPLDDSSRVGPEALHWHPDEDLMHMVIW